MFQVSSMKPKILVSITRACITISESKGVCILPPVMKYLGLGINHIHTLGTSIKKEQLLSRPTTTVLVVSGNSFTTPTFNKIYIYSCNMLQFKTVTENYKGHRESVAV